MNIQIGWDSVQHVGEVGAALFTLALMWRIFRRIDRVVALVPVVEKMAAQFETNGGSTYRDKVNKMGKVQEEHSAMLNQLVGAQNAAAIAAPTTIGITATTAPPPA